MTAINRILCPVDFSEGSRHALDHAVAIARSHGATITAVHVLPRTVNLIPVFGAPLYPPIVYSAGDFEQFRDAVATFATEEGGTFPIEALAMEGDPATEILALAVSL